LLIALDKKPGVRPIGETVHRLVARSVLAVICDNIQAAAGPLQLCVGQLSGYEAAVHCARQLYSSTSVVDASNAFYSLNRAALHSIQHLCPSFSTILINTYRMVATYMVTI